MRFNGDFTQSMKNFVKEKMERLSEYVDYKNTEVSYKALKDDTFKVEISIGSNIRATDTGYDFYEIVSEVIKKLESQIKKYRSSKTYKTKNFDISAGDDIADCAYDEISKEKMIFLSDETSTEAIDEMELLGHSFYIYKDIDRKNICVVYKRYDGSYGLIECR